MGRVDFFIQITFVLLVVLYLRAPWLLMYQAVPSDWELPIHLCTSSTWSSVGTWQARHLTRSEFARLFSIAESESEVAQLCLTLCDPMDCSLPGSSVHGIFQAVVPEWIAISFSRGSSRPRDRTRVSHIVDRRFTVWATREVSTAESCANHHQPQEEEEEEVLVLVLILTEFTWTNHPGSMILFLTWKTKWGTLTRKSSNAFNSKTQSLICKCNWFRHIKVYKHMDVTKQK